MSARKCHLWIFYQNQSANDKTCAVDGETYNPSTKSCHCGSKNSCATPMGKYSSYSFTSNVFYDEIFSLKKVQS